jgi:nitroreductase
MSLLKKIFKKLPPNSKVRAKSLYLRCDIILAGFFSKNSFLSAIYYLLFNSKFKREQRAVLLGRIKYSETLKDKGETRALLRRNTHRLEKGLIMRPRRETFAEGYISETVNCFESSLKNLEASKTERKWASDVLSEYFSVVQDTSTIKAAKSKYKEAQSITTSDIKYIPYPQKSLPECSVTYTQLTDLFIRRRSVRWYIEKQVPMEEIERAVKAASLAPSACNRQPFRFYTTIDTDKASEIAQCALGTAGFSQNIPSIIAVVGDLSSYPSEQDRHVIYIDGALAAMQLMLALETLGISSCPINWPDIEDRERLLSKKLSLSYYERPIMLIAIGYADPEGGIPYSQKKTETEIIKII